MADLRHWYGRPFLVTETARPASALPSARLEPDGWSALGLGAGQSALIIADRWGLVYFAAQTTGFTDLPDADEVEDWLRYLATQCPECGVPDEPGHGEWSFS